MVVRQEEIEREVRKLHWELERRRSEIWDSPPDSRIDRLDPFKIVTHILRVTLYEPEEIPLPKDYRPSGNVPFRIAGFIDRQENTIALAQGFRAPVRRFTLAHEIGHWKLHEGQRYFRDRPMIAGDRTNSIRSLEEREANRFAEELLMPRDLVRIYFKEVFGLETLRNRPPDEALAHWLSAGRNRKVSVTDLSQKGREWIAFLVADHKKDSDHLSLAVRFRVSPTAMSIRLMKLGLI